MLEISSLDLFCRAQITVSTKLIFTKLSSSTPHWHSTTVSLEIYPLYFLRTPLLTLWYIDFMKYFQHYAICSIVVSETYFFLDHFHWSCLVHQESNKIIKVKLRPCPLCSPKKSENTAFFLQLTISVTKTELFGKQTSYWRNSKW